MMEQSLHPPQHSTLTVVVNSSGSQQHRPSAMHNLYTTLRCFLPSHDQTPTETLPSYVAVIIFLVLLLVKLQQTVESVEMTNIPWIIVVFPLFVSNLWSIGRNVYPLYCKFITPFFYGATANRQGYEGIQEVNNGSNHDREGVQRDHDRMDEESAQPAADGSVLSAANNHNNIDQMRESSCKEERKTCQHMSNLLILFASFYGKIVALVCLYKSVIPTKLTLILLPAWISILLAISIKAYDSYFLIPRLDKLNHLRQEYTGPVWSSPFVLIMFTMLRFVQPLLISCQLDRSLQRSWSVILAPFWIVAFLGFAIALLLFSFLPYMNPYQSYASSPLKVAGHKVGYLLAVQIALCSIWLFWSVLVIAESLDYYDQVPNGMGMSSGDGPDDNKGKNFSMSTIMTPLILLWITLTVTSPILHYFTKAFETTLLARSMESSGVSILTSGRDGQQYVTAAQNSINKRCYVETIQRVVWLLQTGASTFVVADPKSLSEDALTENAHIIPSSTNTSRTSIGSNNGSLGGIASNASGAVETLTNTANTVLDWITPLFSNSSGNGSSNHSNASGSQHEVLNNGSASEKRSSLPTDIEMSALPQQGIEHEVSSSGAYADVMMSSQSAMDMNSTVVGGSNNYCVVCLSKPADSVIQDCGHYCCCAGCILSIARASADPAHCTCPICRCTFTTVLQLKGKPFELHSNNRDKDRKKTVAVSHITYSIHDSHNLNQNILRRQIVSAESLKSIEDHSTLLEILS